ncbi:MAG: YhjD/YihY/BrkB family envelope integrity protein, partial [Actinomycetota bacterium]|nr:YhjD/YihY/BrkB family envelope integrity protein [Actinomycetota bacterium]
ALGLGLALIAVWLLNFLWRFVEGLFPDDLVRVHTWIGYLTPLVSIIVLPILFGLIFQSGTVIRIRWRAIWFGASFTAIVFLLAAYGIGLYFAWDEDTSAFTVAGSVFVVLLMAFVLAGVFLFGAQVTKVYADYLAEGDVMQPSLRERALSEPNAIVAEPAPPVPKAAVLGFLGGLFVGWRRTKR